MKCDKSGPIVTLRTKSKIMVNLQESRKIFDNSQLLLLHFRTSFDNPKLSDGKEPGAVDFRRIV